MIIKIYDDMFRISHGFQGCQTVDSSYCNSIAKTPDHKILCILGTANLNGFLADLRAFLTGIFGYFCWVFQKKAEPFADPAF